MPNRYLIRSSNVLVDKDLRRLLAGSPSSSASEVAAIVKRTQLSAQPEIAQQNGHSQEFVTYGDSGKDSEEGNVSSLPREELEVKVKFFPTTFDSAKPREALNRIFESIGSYKGISMCVCVCNTL